MKQTIAPINETLDNAMTNPHMSVVAYLSMTVTNARLFSFLNNRSIYLSINVRIIDIRMNHFDKPILSAAV